MRLEKASAKKRYTHLAGTVLEAAASEAADHPAARLMLAPQTNLAEFLGKLAAPPARIERATNGLGSSSEGELNPAVGAQSGQLVGDCVQILRAAARGDEKGLAEHRARLVEAVAALDARALLAVADAILDADLEGASASSLFSAKR